MRASPERAVPSLWRVRIGDDAIEGRGGEGPVNASDQFHAGVVVDNLEAAMTDLTDLLGYEWCPTLTVPLPVRFPTEERTVELTFTYSVSTPRLELVATVPGTLWSPVAGVHHVGYWSDDLEADGRLLVQRGYSMEAIGVAGNGSALWSYHRKANGFRVELVNRDLQSFLEKYWKPAPLT
jgi:hypothetical protein